MHLYWNPNWKQNKTHNFLCSSLNILQTFSYSPVGSHPAIIQMKRFLPSMNHTYCYKMFTDMKRRWMPGCALLKLHITGGHENSLCVFFPNFHSVHNFSGIKHEKKHWHAPLKNSHPHWFFQPWFVQRQSAELLLQLFMFMASRTSSKGLLCVLPWSVPVCVD